MSSPTATTEIILPFGAAYILGYDQRQMRILHEHDVIGHLAHRVGCGGVYYIRHELIAFKRQVRMDPEYAAWIESLTEDDRDDT